MITGGTKRSETGVIYTRARRTGYSSGRGTPGPPNCAPRSNCLPSLAANNCNRNSRAFPKSRNYLRLVLHQGYPARKLELRTSFLGLSGTKDACCFSSTNCTFSLHSRFPILHCDRLGVLLLGLLLTLYTINLCHKKLFLLSARIQDSGRIV